MVSHSAAAAGWNRVSRAAALYRLLRRLAPPALILAVACVLFATAPVAGDFSYSDAPRHALNGAFVKDFIAAWPWHDPAGWAENYYLQYPALSILFYPPLFYFIEAAAFALFGVSHAVAQGTVAVFYALLGFGVYRTARLFLPRYAALGSALMLMSAPELAFWGRQVMLDIPAYASLSWAAFCFARFLRRDRTRDLACAAALALAAIYIKYNVAFIVPVFALTMIAERRAASFRDQRVLLAAALAALGLLPALWLNLRFGIANFQSAAALANELPRWSVAAWTFYPALLPEILGWPVLLLALAGAALLLAGKLPALKGWPAWLLLAWVLVGYVGFSAIALRAPRHFLPVMTPFVILAAASLVYFLPRRIAGLAACVVGIGTLAYTLIAVPVPVITGHQALADYAAAAAPPDGVVLFSGYRDGNFVFDLRTHEERRDITILRADKLLLRVAVERQRGVGEAAYSEDQIAALIRDLGISLIVAEDGFWDDLTEMRRFARVLNRSDFAVVAHVTIAGTMGHSDKSFTIYRPTYPVAAKTTRLSIEMPIINRTFQGEIR